MLEDFDAYMTQIASAQDNSKARLQLRCSEALDSSYAQVNHP